MENFICLLKKDPYHKRDKHLEQQYFEIVTKLLHSIIANNFNIFLFPNDSFVYHRSKDLFHRRETRIWKHNDVEVPFFTI